MSVNAGECKVSPEQLARLVQGDNVVVFVCRDDCRGAGDSVRIVLVPDRSAVGTVKPNVEAWK